MMDLLKRLLPSISILMLLSIVIITSENADGVLAPLVTIELNQTKQTAYVAPGQDGVVAFTGTVTAEIPWCPKFQYLIVTLEADAGGWPVSIPPSLTFNKATVEQSFSLAVQVPVGTSSAIDGQLTVSGTWQYSPGVMGGSVDPATALIIIDQYYDYQIGCDEIQKDAERSGSVSFDLIITNFGNGDDQIIADVKNDDDLEQQGLIASFSMEVVPVLEASSTELSLNVLVTKDSSFVTYDIEVSICSLIAREQGDIYPVRETTVYLEVVREIKEPEVPEQEEEPGPGPEEEDDDGALPETGSDASPYDDDDNYDDYNTTYPTDTDDGSTNPILAVFAFIAIVIFAVLIVAFKIGISIYFRYKVFDGLRHHVGLGRNRSLFDVLADMGKRN